MKKFFLILCVSTAMMNAMYDYANDKDYIIPSGATQLSVISKIMPMLEAALAQWQLAIPQNLPSAITNIASWTKVRDARREPRRYVYEYLAAVKPLELINLLELQPDSDNPHNKSVLALLSSFNKIKAQFEALEKSETQLHSLGCVLSILEREQQKYEKTAKALQAHLNLKKTEESFFEECKNDYSMIVDKAEFNMYAKYFTPDTHLIRKNLDVAAFSKDWNEFYASKE